MGKQILVKRVRQDSGRGYELTYRAIFFRCSKVLIAMAKTTLTDALHRYEIGSKLRALRLKKKLGLVDLGRHTGLSPALLSKLERGKMFPTLQTLLRIGMVFSVDLDYFFADHRKHRALAVVRRVDRLRFPEEPGRRDPAFHFE